VVSPMRGGHSLAVTLPEKLLNPQKNDIDIVMEPSAWGHGVPDIYMGAPQEVQAAYASFKSHQRWLQIILLVLGIVGLLVAPLTLLVARHYLIVLGAAGLALFQLASVAIATGILPAMLGDVIVYTSGWGIALCGLALVIGSRGVQGQQGGLWLGIGATVIVAALTLLVPIFRTILGNMPDALLNLAPIITQALAMPMLVYTGFQDLNRSQTATRDLVAQQEVVVARQAEEIQRQSDALAVSEERKRFTSDIHDGIGGQLVSLLWRARSEPIPADELTSELERGLADLRLVVDALDVGPMGLSEALWNFAARTRQQLESADIAFDWQLPSDLDVQWQDSRRVLSLYRMLQEAVTNTVRHADATKLSINFGPDIELGEGALRVIIEDNGVGYDQSAKVAGRGVSNLNARSQQLGGTICFGKPTAGSGTRIEIRLLPETR
jgi:signal transduction histidine kinase